MTELQWLPTDLWSVIHYSLDSSFTFTVFCLIVFCVVRAIQEAGEHDENFDQPNQDYNDEEDKYEIAHQIKCFRHFHTIV